MVHIWQHQRGIFLPLKRHPFCRYTYALMGWKWMQPVGAITVSRGWKKAHLVGDSRTLA
jgi:hypothetical protein